MRLILVFGVVGQLLRYFSAAFSAPAIFALVEGDYRTSIHFAFGLALTFVVGTVSAREHRRDTRFTRSEALGVVSLTWLTTAIFAAVPYLFEGLSPVDALFESMSGLTTTGATILADFEGHSRAFYLWRAMSQWFGGVGVIALFVVVLPRLGIAGRQLFFAEASTAPSEAITPRIRDAATRLWMLYGGATLVVIVLLLISGLSLYDAVLHAFTTVSAGGFSPHGQSIAGLDSAAAEWIFVLFMVLAGISFTLQYKLVTGSPVSALADPELRFYLATVLCGVLTITWILGPGEPDSLRQAAFQSASVITGTGYASTDYNRWPDGARAMLVLLMIIGGCAGSAAGGPKAIRWLLVARRIQIEIKSVLHPRGVIPLRYKGQPVSDPIARAVFTLVVLYMGGYFVSGLILVLLGSDLVTGFSAALACLGNIGPAFGPAGPMGSYAEFSDAAKLLLTFDMWVGRLEIVTVLALFHPEVLKGLRLRE
ncbi:MAG: TrkH family potassium uptake protein [Myxococcales bacterium]|nr:TrkH family potassium uptake protein [Myxococcales bacterium]